MTSERYCRFTRGNQLPPPLARGIKSLTDKKQDMHVTRPAAPGRDYGENSVYLVRGDGVLCVSCPSPVQEDKCCTHPAGFRGTRACVCMCVCSKGGWRPRRLPTAIVQPKFNARRHQAD